MNYEEWADEILLHPTTVDLPGEDAVVGVLKALIPKIKFSTIENTIAFLDRMPGPLAICTLSAVREIEKKNISKMTKEERSRFLPIRSAPAFKRWCLQNHEEILAKKGPPRVWEHEAVSRGLCVKEEE